MSVKKDFRKKNADERLAVTSNRTPEAQLKRLDEKYGEGNGAKKERAKLAKRIRDEDTKVAPKEAE